MTAQVRWGVWERAEKFHWLDYRTGKVWQASAERAIREYRCVVCDDGLCSWGACQGWTFWMILHQNHGSQMRLPWYTHVDVA